MIEIADTDQQIYLQPMKLLRQIYKIITIPS